MRKVLVTLSCATLAVAATACALLTQIAAPKHDPTKVACESVRVITYDRLKDTNETIAQILAHNAAWHALCDRPVAEEGTK